MIKYLQIAFELLVSFENARIIVLVTFINFRHPGEFSMIPIVLRAVRFDNIFYLPNPATKR